MGGWAPSPEPFALLPHKTRPVRVTTIDPFTVEFEFNRPVGLTGFGSDTNILLLDIYHTWLPGGSPTQITPTIVRYASGCYFAQRWRFIGSPLRLTTGPPGFKYPIGGPVPYARGWDP